MPSTTIQEAPRRGRPLLQTIGRAVMRLSGWRIVGALPALPKFIIVVAPHTSNWDFLVGVMAMFALDLRIHWFGKDTLFRRPLGALFRRLGGRPINRSSQEGVVAEMASIVRAEPTFLLAVTPEGTRKRVTHWRTGFYRIAEAAGVPIVAVWFDWSRQEIGIAAPFVPTGDVTRDLERIQALFRPEMARHPEAFWGEPSP